MVSCNAAELEDLQQRPSCGRGCCCFVLQRIYLRYFVKDPEAANFFNFSCRIEEVVSNATHSGNRKVGRNRGEGKNAEILNWILKRVCGIIEINGPFRKWCSFSRNSGKDLRERERETVQGEAEESVDFYRNSAKSVGFTGYPRVFAMSGESPRRLKFGFAGINARTRR